MEPYVAAADVYAEPPHVGREGWTWYTGSAGWMYRAGVVQGVEHRTAVRLLARGDLDESRDPLHSVSLLGPAWPARVAAQPGPGQRQSEPSLPRVSRQLARLVISCPHLGHA